MSITTPSGHERDIACPASRALPRSDDVPTEAAARGSAAHRYLALCREMSPRAALQQLRQEGAGRFEAFCASIDIHSIPVEGRAEVAYAYDPTLGTSRILGYNIDRAYEAHGLLPGEIAGTADIASSSPMPRTWVRPDGSLGRTSSMAIVWDWKTGHTRINHVGNHQLELLGLMAARQQGAAYCLVGIVRIHDDGSVHCRSTVLTPLVLSGIEMRVDATIDRIHTARLTLAETGQADVRPSALCQWCPAFKACPSQLQLMRSFAELDPASDDPAAALLTHRGLLPITPENERDALAASRSLARVAEKLITELKAYVRAGPITLDNGNLWGERRVRSAEVLSADVVHAVVAEQHGAEAAEIAAPIQRKATKASIKTALDPIYEQQHVAYKRDGGIRPTKKDLHGAVIGECRARNGSNVNADGSGPTYLKVDEHRPPKTES